MGTAGGAESTNVPSSASTSTSSATSSSTSTPGPSPTAQTGSTSSSSANAGTIAGAVVGGVVGLALIAALVFCFTHRRRTQRPHSKVDLMPPSMPTSPVSPTAISFNQTTPLGLAPNKFHVRPRPSSSALLIFIYSGFPRPEYEPFSNDFCFKYYARASSSIATQLLDSNPAVSRSVISCP
jgi:hypothetical protein